MNSRPTIPGATVARLPLYLQYLDRIPSDLGVVSSDEMADALGINSAKVRKDLWYLGSRGVRGVGYDPARLRSEINEALGLTKEIPIVIVGAGQLGRALAGYQGFRTRGFAIVAIYDVDPAKVGSTVLDIPIHDLSRLDEDAAAGHFSIAVIATPAGAAQDVADRLVASGVRSILSFAPTILRVRPGVEVRQVDVATELQILSFHVADVERRGP